MSQNFYKPMKSITVLWSGTEPLPIPREAPSDKQQFIQPGENTIPTSSWHRMGLVAANVEHIVSGRLRAIHKRHEFAEGDDHCIGCSLSRDEAEAQRVAAGPAK